MKSFDLEQYLNNGIETLVKGILRAAFKNPKASAYFAGYALSAKKAEKRRCELEKQGEHIPSFLIASITGACNLNCAGCYDRANRACGSEEEMSGKHWRNVFEQAEEIGVSAILLAGGEPFMRPDVIEEAAKTQSILFPVFTNGTKMTDRHYDMLEKNRNILPVISIEGEEVQTDLRRGKGVYEKTISTMAELEARGLLFGASITVTSENLMEVTSSEFLGKLGRKGCKAVVFVEYVPVEKPEMALNNPQRDFLEKRVSGLRASEDVIIISFPGDEKMSGGCLAAGRGFFHINAYGRAEPCPFSPYSDTGLKDKTLREALKSPLFTRLREGGNLLKEHSGGCALFDQADDVKALLEVRV